MPFTLDLALLARIYHVCNEGRICYYVIVKYLMMALVFYYFNCNVKKK